MSDLKSVQSFSNACCVLFQERTISGSYKTVTIISQEDFQKMAPPAPRKQNPEVPPPPPPVQHVCIFYEFEKLNIVLYYILITRWKINKRLVRNESDNHSTVAHGSTLSLRTSRQTREHQENEKPGILIIHQWSITSVGSIMDVKEHRPRTSSVG